MRDKILRITNIITWAVFVLFIGYMCLTYIFGPKSDYSENEKRYLASTPKLNVDNVLSGEFAEDAEDYAADHIPGRTFLVGLNANVEKILGLQNTKEIIVGKSGRLYERPSVWDQENAEKNISALNDFAAYTGKNVDLMLVPSAGYIMQEDMPTFSDEYKDGEFINKLEGMLNENVHMVDITETFLNSSDKEDLYYETDHHWTSKGAHLAASIYTRTAEEAEYEIEKISGFYGTTYSRSALWQHESEDVELWKCGKLFTVENADAEGINEGLFYYNRLDDIDKYTVFLDGNHSLVTIHNEEAEGKILIIRDSFANCLGGFIAENFKETVLVDLRYFRDDVASLAKDGDFDKILVIYNAGNFIEDLNVVKMEPEEDETDFPEDEVIEEISETLEDETSQTFITSYETVDYETGEKVTKEMAVYLPAGYTQNEKYNVMILMHTSGSDEQFWLGLGIQDIMDKLISEGTIEKTIVFMPDGYINDEKRTHRGDDTIYIQMSGELRNDIVPFIKENYSVYEEREHYAFVGASFGAYMTVNSALCTNLDLFSNFGYIGGGTIEQEKLESNWYACSTQDLPINMLYIGEGDRDDRQPAELSYIYLMAGCDKFNEDNLIFSLMEGYAHEPAEWILGVEQALQLFWPQN